MDATFELQLPTASLAQLVEEDMQALLSQVGFSTDVLERLLDPKVSRIVLGWAAP